MNTYNINDEYFKSTSIYENFLKENSATGSLRIRAYAANEAIPISGVKITVQNKYNDNIIIFYEGITDESGVTPKIVLPAPRLSTDNLEAPKKLTYEIIIKYPKDNLEAVYKVNIYEDICVMQNINIVPNEEGVM